MSQAEELLNGMAEEVPVHTHPVPDTDTYFVIDPITRKIENTNPKKNVIMQYDHNSERFTFELPRYIDGHDMLECTSVTVNVDNIEVIESDGEEPIEPCVNSDAPDMTDLRLHPTDPEKVICSWLISRNSTQLAGILSFHIEFKCVDSAGNVVYEWSTDQYDEIIIKARKKNGAAAIAEHSDLLEQWRTRIFGAGDSVMANIAAEGEAQVAAVKAESETQQNAVELKGAQTLDTIPEDYIEIDAMATEAVRSKGDAIVCEAVGESIVLKDSSDDYIRGLKVFGKSSQVSTNGKNLVNFIDATKLGNGVTGVFENGVLTVSGTPNITEGEVFTWFAEDFDTSKLVDGVTYYAKDCSIQITFNDETKKWVNEFTYTNTIAAIRIYIQRLVADYVDGETIRPMVSMDKNDAWEPYTGGKPSPNPDYPQEICNAENAAISVFGKNLLKPKARTETINGITFTVSEDGTVAANGTATKATFLGFGPDLTLTPGESYILSGSPEGGGFDTYMLYLHYKESGLDVYNRTGETKFTARDEGFSSVIVVYEGVSVNNLVFRPMVRLASIENGDFEAYSEQNVTIPRALPGIPVTTDGNYTDSDGQQWICDEIDLERGVYVKRISSVTYSGTEAEWIATYGLVGNGFAVSRLSDDLLPPKTTDDTSTAFCDKLAVATMTDIYSNGPDASFGFSTSGGVIRFCLDELSGYTVDQVRIWLTENPLTFTYVLSTPIETPLTAEEIVAFKALRTNYPNTTILNDAGAWMSVKYNADTKNYVENPKILKLVDSSTGVVYELKIVNGSLTVNPV